jgi:ABC-2 type transport system ATP-binding protein
MLKILEERFTYTAQRTSYLTSIAVLSFILLSEGGVLAALIWFFAHNEVLRLALLVPIGGLYLTLLTFWLAPFWTTHRLSATHFSLHYGFALRTRIPRNLIESAQPVQERLTMLEPLTVRYNAQKDRVVAAFSEHGQVLLSLEKPFPCKVGRATRLVKQILLNVDERETFLAVLASSSSAQDVPLSPNQLISMIEPQFSVSQLTHPALPIIAADALLMLHTQNLTRRYGDVTVVDHLNLAVRRGEIYGFLGPNGAGKSTTIKMLVGLLKPTSGSASLAGHDIWHEPLQAKRALGYVADRVLLYDRLTGREFLSFLAQLRGLSHVLATERIARLLDLLELSEQSNYLCGSYSFGMKRKLSLAGALLHEPALLILDEPLNGLDPLSARRLKDLFLHLAASGTTIFLSTHDLATAESICHRVGIIQRGRLLAEGTAEELRARASAPDLESVFLSLTAHQEEVVA